MPQQRAQASRKFRAGKNVLRPSTTRESFVKRIADTDFEGVIMIIGEPVEWRLRNRSYTFAIRGAAARSSNDRADTSCYASLLCFLPRNGQSQIGHDQLEITPHRPSYFWGGRPQHVGGVKRRHQLDAAP